MGKLQSSVDEGALQQQRLLPKTSGSKVASNTEEKKKSKAAGEALSIGKEALEYQLKVSSTWVLVMIASQLILSTYWLYAVNDDYGVLLLHTLFVMFGMGGVQMRSKCLVFSHLLYTFILTSLVLLSVFGLLNDCWLNGWDGQVTTIAFGVAFALIQSVGMKHERALLVLFPLSEEVESVEADINKGYASEDEPLLLSTPTTQGFQPQMHQAPLHTEHLYSTPLEETTVGNMHQQQQQQYVSEYMPTLPQYPIMLPPHPGQQQQFVVLPFHVTPAGFPDQEYLPPMMYFHPNVGVVPYPHPYPPVMVPAPAQLYNQEDNNNNAEQ